MSTHHITRRPRRRSCVFMDDLPRGVLMDDPAPPPPPPPPAIVVDFVGTPLIGFSPLVVAFTNLSTGALSYVWDFGDGSPNSTAVNPTNTYTAVGVYTVSLTGTGPSGTDNETKIAYVEVIEALQHADLYSAIYPAEFTESLNLSLGFDAATLITWPEETHTVSHAFLGGTLTAVSATYADFPAEGVSVAHEFIGGELTTVQITHPVPPEETVEVGHQFLGGVLTTVQINYTDWTPEALDFTFGFESGVLS